MNCVKEQICKAVYIRRGGDADFIIVDPRERDPLGSGARFVINNRNRTEASCKIVIRIAYQEKLLRIHVFIGKNFPETIEDKHFVLRCIESVKLAVIGIEKTELFGLISIVFGCQSVDRTGHISIFPIFYIFPGIRYRSVLDCFHYTETE